MVIYMGIIMSMPACRLKIVSSFKSARRPRFSRGQGKGALAATCAAPAPSLLKSRWF